MSDKKSILPGQRAEEQKSKKNLHLMLAIIRYYRLVTFILIVVIVALSYHFILEPKYRQVGSGGKFSLAALKQEVVKRQEHLNDLKRLIANYQNISQTDIDRLKKILPKGKDIPGLFVQFQALAEENNLLLASVSINETPETLIAKETAGTISKLDISLDLVGAGGSDYEGIKEFLASLENNLRLFDVNAVYFNPDSTVYSVDLFTYYY